MFCYWKDVTWGWLSQKHTWIQMNVPYTPLRVTSWELHRCHCTTASIEMPVWDLGPGSVCSVIIMSLLGDPALTFESVKISYLYLYIVLNYRNCCVSYTAVWICLGNTWRPGLRKPPTYLIQQYPVFQLTQMFILFLPIDVIFWPVLKTTMKWQWAGFKFY